MRIVCCFLCLFTLFSSFAPYNNGRDKLDWLVGVWEGVGHQEGSSWQTRLTFLSIHDPITIEYTSSKCKGEWTFLDYKNHRVFFKEKIQEGTAYCIQDVDVIVASLDESHISVGYYLKNTSPKIMAYAMLTKTQ